MRKEKKHFTAAETARVQGYHEGGRGWMDREAYAFQGFKGGNRYYTSDRDETLTADYQRPNGKPLKGYGLEIETVSRIPNQTVLAEVLEKVVFTHFPEGLFKMQDDCSLGGESSAECITQVMTREAVRNMYPAFKQMYDVYFPAFGITAGDRSCGMHVNVSNACFGTKPEIVEDNVRKLLYFVNRHFEFCCALVDRSISATHYCERMDAYTTKAAAQRADLATMGGSHGICLNMMHFSAGRVELRLVGGQKSFPAFRNTMESVFALIDGLRNTKWEKLDDLPAVFRGCNKYAADRIRSLCLQRGTISREDAETIWNARDTETAYL